MNPYEPSGTLASILGAVDAPGQVVRNLLRGNPGAAGRKARDFLGDLIDAPLPGNWLDHISRPEDDISGGELVGIDEPGISKTLADIGIGVLTDPLSLISFGAPEVAAVGARQALRLGLPGMSKEVATFGREVDPLSLVRDGADYVATKGAGKIDELLANNRAFSTDTQNYTPASDWLNSSKLGVKDTLGWLNVNPENEAQIQMAAAAGNNAARAGAAEVERIFKRGGDTLIPEAEQNAIGQAFNAVERNGQGWVSMPGTSVDDRLAYLHQKDPTLDLQRMRDATQDLHGLNRTFTADATDAGAIAPFFGPSEEYMPHMFSRPQNLGPDLRDAYAANPNALRERILQTPDQVAEFLNNKPEAGMEMNSLRAFMGRATQQGKIVSKGTLGKSLVDAAAPVNPLTNIPQQWSSIKDSNALAMKVIEDIGKADPETAMRLNTAYNGMDERNGFNAILASANRYIKPALTSGVIMPKVGFMVRNRLGMNWQALTQEMPASSRLELLKRTGSDLYRSADEAWSGVLGRKYVSPDEIGLDIGAIDSALTNSKGSLAETRKLLAGNPSALAALEHGVLDGFIASEDLLSGMAKSKGWEKAKDVYDAPSQMTQLIEQRGRYGLFKSLLNKNYTPEKAASVVRESFLDYSITSGGNRTLRDWIPFAQFMAKSIPQQAKFLSKNPIAATALAPLYGSSEDQPVYPYMQGQAHAAMGLDEKGNPQFLSGLGLPVEALNSLPDLSNDLSAAGRSVLQNVVGATQPFVKSGISAIFGVDPYFQTPYGSYAKDPITGKNSDAGRVYRMLQGTGILEPLGGNILRQAESLTDDRKSAGVKALNQLTGFDVRSVDPDQAQRQILDQALRNRPDVARYTSYYQPGEVDPDVQELFDRMKKAKANLKDKREAEKIAASTAL